MNPDSIRHFDLAVAGAGAYGAAVAYEAATRGLSVFLTDKGDFGSGTSANSLKIVHGGLRYLQDLDFRRARSSAKERSTLLRIAPGLVKPLRCIMPTGWELRKSRFVLGAGLALNAALTFDRNREIVNQQRLPAGGIVSRGELARMAPGLHMSDVSGGASWFDAVMRDSERLCLALVLSARDAGADVHNYVSAERILQSGGKAIGLAVRDQLTGIEREVRARAIIGCHGPWSHSTGLVPGGQTESAGLVRAVNVILPNAGLKCAVGFPARDVAGRPRGNRLLFAVPWHGLSIVGTWYFPPTAHLDNPTVSTDELELILSELNSGFEAWNFDRKDVLMFHVGHQPAQANGDSIPQPVNAPIIMKSAEHGGPSNAWVLQGEKWSTARGTAQVVVESIAKTCGLELGQSRSSRMPLYSGPDGLTGSMPIPDLCAPESERRMVAAELLIYATNKEMVRTLPDLLLRRTNIGAGGRPPAELTERISRLVARELGWNEATRRQNVDAIHGHDMYPND